jgi:hypothetical protein
VRLPASRPGPHLLSMVNFMRTVTPDPEVLAVIVTCTEFGRLEDGSPVARVDPRLETPLLERTERVFAELGGHWDRQRNATVLPPGIDPDRLVEQLLDGGSVTLKATLVLSV